MRRRVLQVGPLAILLAACGSPPRPVVAPPQPQPVVEASPPAPAPAPAPPPVPEAPPSPPPAPWARVYRRACDSGSITAPILSVDGKTVTACGASFDVERGRFVGLAREHLLAFLPGGRALTEDYGDGGVTVEGSGPAEHKHDAAGMVEDQLAAISADATKVVTVEAKDGANLLVVRKLPSLERVRVTPVGTAAHAFTVGFLADGREAVLADQQCVPGKCAGSTCDAPTCAGRALLTVESGALVPIVPGVEMAAIGARGDVAAVVRKDGSAALVALPDGHVVASFAPPVKNLTPPILAVSPAGDRVAWASDGKLAVLGRSGSAFVEVLSAEQPNVSALRFSVDGRTLFAGHALVAYREGTAARPAPPLPYAVTLPNGFVAVPRDKDGVFAIRDGKNDREWGTPEDVESMYYHATLGVTVRVIALDPDEIGPEGDAETWGLRAASRLFPHLPLATPADRRKRAFAAWGDANEGRAMELEWHEAGGCDSDDGYARLAEHEGRLYLIRIETPGKFKADRSASWLKAFFDEPLGVSAARAKAPAVNAVHEEHKGQKKGAHPKKKAPHTKKKKKA